MTYTISSQRTERTRTAWSTHVVLNVSESSQDALSAFLFGSDTSKSRKLKVRILHRNEIDVPAAVAEVIREREAWGPTKQGFEMTYHLVEQGGSVFIRDPWMWGEVEQREAKAEETPPLTGSAEGYTGESEEE